MCIQVKRPIRSLSSTQPLPGTSNLIQPLPGPSNVTQASVAARTNNQRIQSDVLTAPELQLDCFSDSSSNSSNDVIAIVI